MQSLRPTQAPDSKEEKSTYFDTLKADLILRPSEGKETSAFEADLDIREFTQEIEAKINVNGFLTYPELKQLKIEINAGQITTSKFIEEIKHWETVLSNSNAKYWWTYEKTGIAKNLQDQYDQDKTISNHALFTKKYFNSLNDDAKPTIDSKISETTYKAFLLYLFVDAYYTFERNVKKNYASRTTCDLNRPQGSLIAAAVVLHEYDRDKPIHSSLIDDFWMLYHPSKNDKDNPDSNFIVQAGTAIGGTAGLAIGYGLQYLFGWFGYPKYQPLDPLHRIAKTYAAVGQNIGIGLSMLILPGDLHKIPAAVLSSLFAFIGVLIAIPVSYFQDNSKETYCHTNHEGSSKYGKTALVWGSSPGILLGAILCKLQIGFFATLSMGSAIAFGGVAVGVGLFVASIIIVPLKNWLWNEIHTKADRPDAHKFRNNYTRAGISVVSAFSASLILLGATLVASVGLPLIAALGALIGIGLPRLLQLHKDKANDYNILFILGSVLLTTTFTLLGAILFPTILAMSGGVILTLAIGAAVGGTLGGPLFSKFGSDISLYLQKNWGVKTKDSDNNWDFSVRAFVNLVGSLGICVGFGFFIFFPPASVGAMVGTSFVGAAFIFPTICNYVGQAIGAVIGLYVSPAISNEDDKTELTTTQRISVGLGQGNTLGGIIGLGVGFAIGGPAGAVIGFGAGNSFLGFVGGVMRGIPQKKYDDLLIWLGIRTPQAIVNTPRSDIGGGSTTKLSQDLTRNSPPDSKGSSSSPSSVPLSPISPVAKSNGSNWSPKLLPQPANGTSKDEDSLLSRSLSRSNG